MKKTLINILCAFIPVKKYRKKARIYLINHLITFSTKQYILNIDYFLKTYFQQNKITASGNLREFQLATLKILKEVDRVCKEANITYWIDYGTLLGAIRNGGFIPWDDDIDISMMREDYKTFQEVFQKHCKNGYYAEFITTKGKCHFLKIKHHDVPSISLDIFPYDTLPAKLSLDENIRFSHSLDKLSRYLKKKNLVSDKDEYTDVFEKYQNEMLIKNIQPNNGKSVFIGSDYRQGTPFLVFDYESMFPLTTVEFEGEKFPAPCDWDKHLTFLYRDYMVYPQTLDVHTNIASLSLADILSIKDFINKKP